MVIVYFVYLRTQFLKINKYLLKAEPKYYMLEILAYHGMGLLSFLIQTWPRCLYVIGIVSCPRHFENRFSSIKTADSTFPCKAEKSGTVLTLTAEKIGKNKMVDFAYAQTGLSLV